MRRASTPVLCTAVAVVTALILSVAPAGSAPPICDVTWDGGAGTSSWHDAANWTGDAVPGAGANVCIPASSLTEHDDSGTTTTIASLQGAGAVNLEAGELQVTGVTEAVLAEFQLSGGTLSGAGRLTVGGELDWSDGTMAGAGSTVVGAAASLVVDPGDFSFVALDDSRILRVDGSATWSTGGVHLGGSSLLETVGTFRANSETGGISGAETARFRNAGLLRKAAGTGETSISAPSENDGTVDAQTGTLSLDFGAAGFAQTGQFGASGVSAKVRLGGVSGSEFVLGAGAALTGRVELARGAIVVEGSVSASGSNALVDADLIGSGTLAVTGSLLWTGGSMGGSGTTQIEAAGSLTIDPDNFSIVFLGGDRTLRITGTASWPDGGLAFTDDAFMEVLGTLVANSETGALGTSGDGQYRFRNAGVVRKTAGTGHTTIDVPIENDGTIDAQTGTLSVQNGAVGFAQSGNFGASGVAAELRLATLFGSEFELAGGASLTGRVKIRGPVAVVGPVSMSGPGNELTFLGTLTGSGTLSVTGSLLWSGGTMDGAGMTAIRPTGSLSIDGGGDLEDGRLLRVEGSAIWSSGDVGLSGTARIENLGVFDAKADGDEIRSFFNVETEFYNRGTLTKTAGPGTAEISLRLVNDGVVDPRVGTLRVEELLGNAYAQTIDGRQRVELSGTTPGAGFGVLSLGGTARLNGTLEIVTAPGFDPQVGNSFAVLTYGSRSGEFAAIQGAQIDPSKAYQVQYGPAGVTLTVVSTGGGGSPAAPQAKSAEVVPALTVTGLEVRTVRARRYVTFRVSRPALFRGRLERAARSRVRGARRTRFVGVRRLPDLALATGPQRIAVGALRPGHYRARIVVRDGEVSVTRTALFRVRK